MAALSVIDPDIGRKPWIAIGYALYAQVGEEKGLELWSKWSSGKLRGSESQKYKESEMEYQWQSLVAGKYPYDMPTVFYHANEARNPIDQAPQQTAATTSLSGQRWMRRPITASLARSRAQSLLTPNLTQLRCCSKR